VPFAFVATGTDHVAYLVFRGTDSDADWVETLKLDQVDDSHATGYDKVNMGLNGINSSMSADILQAIATIESPERIWITGHSLGSAVSTLAIPDVIANLRGAEAGAIIHCIFASPRTGDPVIATAYDF
jgi:predicted lipase